ncbi:4-diphosphocytidyl-2-C-methyl-D-erythritol kinase [Methylomarinovum caldicuralii]|uniref:4-diphosphocytidyl-2-C-methyl-D-erythritol kinase n=1 Tax=Methylomarinovum caldicuralii TaxID=438856 RepID=A0AAU9BPD6_9GAMM|nr:4-(cytidine 5'-diphospho)-2-C-methyl-D-erythritol kinase [Methylomarinovum caldicuralii]BCX80553.1 4-diphosphocytidyl-2-C-methyl-D-erythritol kinase [Methylomarinovum caldicuralii]
MTELENWPAPAKLNLMLRIVGRRPDGYHLLQTVFQFVDWADSLHFRWRDDDQVVLATPLPGVPPDRDLTVRAARALQRLTGVRRGVEIRLDKRLPMGGGLGGGSSDAATVLVALNALWGLGLSETALLEVGVELGADVPVFIKGVAAWAEGVGERLTPVEPPQPWYVILVPPCEVATAAVFGAEDLTRNSPPAKISDFLAGLCGNDFLPVVRRLYPQVDAALADLARHGQPRLTGTGACVYAAFPERDRAEAVAAALARRWRVQVARGLNRSPLLDKLAQLR